MDVCQTTVSLFLSLLPLHVLHSADIFSLVCINTANQDGCIIVVHSECQSGVFEDSESHEEDVDTGDRSTLTCSTPLLSLL